MTCEPPAHPLLINARCSNYSTSNRPAFWFRVLLSSAVYPAVRQNQPADRHGPCCANLHACIGSRRVRICLPYVRPGGAATSLVPTCFERTCLHRRVHVDSIQRSFTCEPTRGIELVNSTGGEATAQPCVDGSNINIRHSSVR